MGGSEFVRRTSGLSAADRDRAVVAEIEGGNIPEFLSHLRPVQLRPQAPGEPPATIWVTPDYLAIGSDEDFLYVPLTYYSATAVADRFGCVLPTPRMVDAIYEQSAHHLTPSPLPAGPLMRSNAYLSTHQRQIDEQRSGLPLGDLISGHKKDLVLSNLLLYHPGRVAIYGWHRATGVPIQPLSTVHGALYVDYSHGVRLVSDTVVVDGQPRSIYEALKDSQVAPVLSREGVTRDAWGLMHPRLPEGSQPAPAGQHVIGAPRASRSEASSRSRTDSASNRRHSTRAPRAGRLAHSLAWRGLETHFTASLTLSIILSVACFIFPTFWSS